MILHGIKRIAKKIFFLFSLRNNNVNETNNLFWKSFVDYKTSNNKVSFSDSNNFKYVVSVQGFGYSGSGAVLDLLREYEDVLTFGNVDTDSGSLSIPDGKTSYEMDFLRLSGGLFEFERYIQSNNVFQNDALLQRFVSLINSSAIYRFFKDSRVYFHEFLNSISLAYWVGNKHRYRCYNWHLTNETSTILFLKKFSIDEYRNLCRVFLNSIFNLIHLKSGCNYLILDQLMCDLEFDIDKYYSYVRNLKQIIVYRDPRDIYTYAKRNDVLWIPYQNVNNFIDWYKYFIARFNVNENNFYCVVRYEDLVNNYITEVKKIEDFLELPHKNHTHKKSCFNPDVSKYNIGIWKACYSSDQYSYDMIERQLRELCYFD